MVLLTVLPISNKLPPGSIQYIHTTVVVPGALVEVPLRTGTLYAVVLSCVDIRNAKLDMKRMKFVPKRIIQVLEVSITNKQYIERLIRLAHWYKTSPEYLWHSLVNSSVGDCDPEILGRMATIVYTDTTKPNTITYIQDTLDMRVRQYLDTCHNDYTVHIVCPTDNDVAYVYECCKESDYPIVSITNRTQFTKYLHKPPVTPHIIVSTISYAFPWLIGQYRYAVVFEDPANDHYATYDNAHHSRIPLWAYFWMQYEVPVMFAATVLPWYWLSSITSKRLNWKMPVTISVLPVAKQPKHNNKKRSLDAITESIVNDIQYIRKKTKHPIGILVPGDHIGAYTKCRSCGYVAICTECQHLLSVRESAKGVHNYYCSQCQTVFPITDQCPVCFGLSLQVMRPGVKSLFSAIQYALPELSVSLLTGRVKKNADIYIATYTKWKELKPTALSINLLYGIPGSFEGVTAVTSTERFVRMSLELADRYSRLVFPMDTIDQVFLGAVSSGKKTWKAVFERDISARVTLLKQKPDDYTELLIPQ